MKVGVDLTQPGLFKTTAMFVSKCLFLFIWLSRVSIVACGILAFWPRIGCGPPTLGVLGPSHWATRQVPQITAIVYWASPMCLLDFPMTREVKWKSLSRVQLFWKVGTTSILGQINWHPKSLLHWKVRVVRVSPGPWSSASSPLTHCSFSTYSIFVVVVDHAM